MPPAPLLALAVGFVLDGTAPRVGARVDERVDERAAPATRPASSVTAPRVADAPRVDGRGDDRAWSEAARITGFVEHEPDEGATPRFRTEARVAHDDRHLYVLVRMDDPAADSIVAVAGRRDERVPSDQVAILLDTFHDRRSGVLFAVNAAGLMRDSYWSNDTVEDPSWNAVWDAAVSRDAGGWTAEFRIPLSQLRFPAGDAPTAGLIIQREVARTGQRIGWPLVSRSRPGFVSQAGVLAGLHGGAARPQLQPYLLGRAASSTAAATAGLDLRVALPRGMTLDATVNPDFSQVEADPALLNLGDQEILLGERRPFFLEGGGFFAFNLLCADIDAACTGLFYPRRVGRAPQLRQLHGPTDVAGATILGATKLTGRLGAGTQVGMLVAATAEERGAGGVVEPATRTGVLRVRHDLRGGESAIGAMATLVDRSLDATTDDWLRDRARVLAVDARHRFAGGRWELVAYAARSRVAGDPRAIARLQRDAVHRYQRPDDALEVDTTRASLEGDGERITLSKWGGGRTRLQTMYQRFSPGFEANDAGYLPRADEQHLRHWMQLQWNRPTALYNRFLLNLNQATKYTADGLRTAVHSNVNGRVQLRNLWWLRLGMSLNNFVPADDDRAARGGPAVRVSPSWNFHGAVEGADPLAVRPVVRWARIAGDEGRSLLLSVDPSVELRAGARARVSLGANLLRVTDDRQWVASVAGAGGPEALFARMEQRTVGLTGRVTGVLTPTLTLQLHANPFVSAGRHSDFRTLSATPRAERYAARYAPWAGSGAPAGFSVAQLRANAVLRWEYRPGSTLFVVLTQDREGSDPTRADDGVGGATRILGALAPRSALQVKLSYWIG